MIGTYHDTIYNKCENLTERINNKSIQKNQLVTDRIHTSSHTVRGQHFIVCFVALHPKSTAMVMAGRSVTTLFFRASLNKQLTSTLCTYFRL